MLSYYITGRIVLHCIKDKLFLKDLSLAEYQKFSDQFDEDIFAIIDVVSVIESHNTKGGTAKASVLKQLELVKQQLNKTQSWLDNNKQVIDVAFL